MSSSKSVGGRLRRAVAFTLVELLVVIGIIALLISILLPSLAKARDAAVTVQCMSQMRQIGQFIAMYANDNNGVFPMTVSLGMRHDTWQDHLIPYDGRKFTDAQMNNWVIEQQMGQFAKWLYCCPTQLGLNEAAGNNAPNSYVWTSYLANLCTYWQNWDWTSGVYMPQITVTGGTIIPGKQLSSIRDPANVIMVCEMTYACQLGGGPAGVNGMQGWGETMRDGLKGQLVPGGGAIAWITETERPHNGVGAGVKPVACSIWWAAGNIFNFRTRGKYNYLMVDGHVASLDPMETLAPRLVPPTLSTQNGMWVDGKNAGWHW